MSGGMGGGEAGVPDDLLTTKGDTHGYTTENARVGIGSDDQVLTADSAQALGLAWKDITHVDSPWTQNHDFDTYYYDMQTQSEPSNPSASNGRVYAKQIDANNDGLFIKVKKNGGFVEVQIA